MEEYLERYIARSQEVKAEIAANASMLDRIKRVRDLRPGERDGLSWHGNFHSVYSLGQLPSGLWVVARVPNHRVYNKIGDLEYCAEKSAETHDDYPSDIVPSFCVGVVPNGISFPYKIRKDNGVLLLTEDLTQGGRYNIRNQPDTSYGIIQETQKKVWYDFDKSNDRHLLKEKA